MNNISLEGYYAFKQHLPQSDNPFKEEAEKQQWENGWEEDKMDADLNHSKPQGLELVDPLPIIPKRR
jgi:ribosome modulation factor